MFNPEIAGKSLLGEQRDHQLAEAKSELLKQECKVETLNTCIRQFQRQAYDQRFLMESVNCGLMKNFEESKPGFTKMWLHEKKALRDTRIRNIYEMENLKRAQEMRVDEFSFQKLKVTLLYKRAHFTNTGTVRKNDL